MAATDFAPFPARVRVRVHVHVLHQPPHIAEETVALPLVILTVGGRSAAEALRQGTPSEADHAAVLARVRLFVAQALIGWVHDEGRLVIQGAVMGGCGGRGRGAILCAPAARAQGPFRDRDRGLCRIRRIRGIVGAGVDPGRLAVGGGA